MRPEKGGVGEGEGVLRLSWDRGESVERKADRETARAGYGQTELAREERSAERRHVPMT